MNQPRKFKTKDWEVIEMLFHGHYSHPPNKECGELCEIKSVKRLSDGEVFKVGDETTQDKIRWFENSGDEMYIHYEGGGWGYIQTAKKATPLPPQSKQEAEPFVWTDEKVKEFVIAYNKVDTLITGADPIGQTIKEWKENRQSEPAPQQPERITVGSVIHIGDNDDGGWYQFDLPNSSESIEIPEEKFPAIKEAIERVLNNEGDWFTEYMELAKKGVKFSDRPIFSAKQLNEEREKAFNAARENVTARGRYYTASRNKYGTFEDYLKSI